jgi:antitoxin component of MazEF toxin-antitoxin module
MIVGRVRKSGNSLILTIPRDEAEKYGITAGDLVAADIRPVDIRPRLEPDLLRHAEESFAYNEAGIRVLADR